MSAFSDFKGGSNGRELIDPRVVFFEVFRRMFGDERIVVPLFQNRDYLTDREVTTTVPHSWYPPADLEWVAQEMKYQAGKPMYLRAEYLHKCFCSPDKAPRWSSVDILADLNNEIEGDTTQVPEGRSLHSAVKGNPQSGNVSDSIGRPEVTARQSENLEGPNNREQANDGIENIEQARIKDDTYKINHDSSDSVSVRPRTFSCQLCPLPDTSRMIACSAEQHRQDPSTNRMLDWYYPECWHSVQEERERCRDSSRDSTKRRVSSLDFNSLDFDSSDKKRLRLSNHTKSLPKQFVTKQFGRSNQNDNHDKSPNPISREHNELISKLPLASPTTQQKFKRDVRGWQEVEKLYVQNLMEEVMMEGGTAARTERRWIVVSERLASRFGISRSWTSIKNYWNRQGRQTSGIDERNTKHPDRMTTGVQNKEQRRSARDAKKKASAIKHDDDDDDAASDKSFLNKLGSSAKNVKVKTSRQRNVGRGCLGTPLVNGMKQYQQLMGEQAEGRRRDGGGGVRDNKNFGSFQRVDALASSTLVSDTDEWNAAQE